MSITFGHSPDTINSCHIGITKISSIIGWEEILKTREIQTKLDRGTMLEHGGFTNQLGIDIQVCFQFGLDTSTT